jgi:hypothetical protein
VRTLTRLALGASAVSAATVLGGGLPAVASHGSSANPPAPNAAAVSAAPVMTANLAAAEPTSATPATRRTAAAKKPSAPHARVAHARPAASHRTTSHTVSHRTSRTVSQPASHRTASHPATTRAGLTRRSPSAAMSSRTTRVTGGRTSSNWSGYTQSSRQVGRPVTSVAGSWQVPLAWQHRPGEAEAAADWIGIGGTAAGSRDASLIQAGTATTIGRSGFASYTTWFETLPSASVATPIEAHPGDRMSVAIGRASSDRWKIRMANATTGHSWSRTVRYRSGTGSADWVSERPSTDGSQLAPLAARKATSFRHARVNGAPAHFRSSQRVTMVGNGGRLATPSAPEAQGDGFSVCSFATHCGAGSH